MAKPDEAAEVPAAAVERILTLENGISLTLRTGLRTGSLFVKDKEEAKRNRSRLCGIAVGGSSAEFIIPYYNILWAGIFQGDGRNELVIDWAAEKSTAQFRPSKLRYEIRNTPIATVEAWVETLLRYSYSGAQRGRRAKVLVNPHAGPGNAVRLWENDVKPLFEAARMELDVVTTSRGGEGTEICEALDIHAYDIVVVCSGDGLAYEVFNGLGKRADAGKALQKIAVAHIPCGSGNAMSCNLNGSYAPGPSALAVIKGIRTSVDLMSVTQGSQRTLSFLSQSVGIVAECDLGTENLRWLGAKRFDVGIAQRIFSKKVYPCDIAIKVEIEGKDQIKAHYRRIRDRQPQSHKEEGGESAAGASSSTSDIQPDAGEGLPPLRFGTVKDPLPEDWQLASCDKLGNFYCGNMAWMAPNANFFPAACINDGLMDVIINDGDISPLKYIDLMTSVEANKHFDKQLLSYQKAVAYRFTPRDQADGYISIDGERVPFEPFQVEIHPGLGTVISKNARYEADGPPGWKTAV
ncbi:sphingoid long chain base kinase-like protein [Xylaria cf. heliscus]|nr:sphingoid long chain base kinase-like protein [Xylaria cf. heliscus]